MLNTAKRRYFTRKGVELFYVVDSRGWVQKLTKEGIENIKQYCLRENFKLERIIDPEAVDKLVTIRES